MHESALAEAVVSTVLKASEREKLKQITKLKVKIGELQQIELETERGVLKCKVCSHKWPFSDTTINEEESESIHFIPEIAKVYIRCPKCKSPDFEIVEGRGVWIESIEGVK